MRPSTTACRRYSALIQHFGHFAVGKALHLHICKQCSVLLSKAICISLALLHSGPDVVSASSALLHAAFARFRKRLAGTCADNGVYLESAGFFCLIRHRSNRLLPVGKKPLPRRW